MNTIKLCNKHSPSVIIVFFALLFFYLDISIPQEINEGELDCERCHTCKIPTAHQPCLISCPRDVMVHQKAKHDLNEAPDSMVLGILSDLYLPVHFNHQLHASMAEMDDSCGTCHHYSPAGHIPPCRECHEAGTGSTDLTKPSLKGAYHRQCLSCHREWSHDTNCIICHIPASDEILAAELKDSTNTVGISHPITTIPVTMIYQGSFEKGPIVTFQHREHIDMFGFRCVDCHREESCSNCHDIQKQPGHTLSEEELHQTCNSCHAGHTCTKCHDNKERPGFSHNNTGWPLGKYHEQLECWSCHTVGRQINRLNQRCVNCHADWNQKNFRHAITGLDLDEMHSQLDCTDCHAEQQYDQTPKCSDCHDDDRDAETVPPGVWEHPHQ